jgi:hypothetical protein
MTRNAIRTPVYSFSAAPPIEPRLYFPESKLINMAIWGTFACPYSPPQHTVFPSDGQIGRWTLHFDDVDPLTDVSPWKLLAQLLPGMRMRYQDFETGNTWIWVLTDQIIKRDNNNDLRLGRWPD